MPTQFTEAVANCLMSGKSNETLLLLVRIVLRELTDDAPSLPVDLLSLHRYSMLLTP